MNKGTRAWVEDGNHTALYIDGQYVGQIVPCPHCYGYKSSLRGGHKAHCSVSFSKAQRRLIRLVERQHEEGVTAHGR